MTKRRVTERGLEKKANQFQILFERSPDAIILLDKDKFIDCNAAALAIFGCKNSSEILDGNFIKKFSPPLQPDGGDSMRLSQDNIAKAFKDGSNRFEWMHCRADGSVFPSEVSLVSFEQDGRAVVQGTIRDITEKKVAEAQMQELAFIDPLTHVFTRRLFEDRLTQVLLKTARSKEYAALFFIDLDKFKRLNDQFGHHVGDLRLIDVAKCLNASVRSEDTVARIGGDEFVVLINELSPDIHTAKPQVINIAEKIVKQLAINDFLKDPLQKPCRLDGSAQYDGSASVGVVLFSGKQRSAEQLLEQADAAMYQAKQAGGNRYQFYESDVFG